MVLGFKKINMKRAIHLFLFFLLFCAATSCGAVATSTNASVEPTDEEATVGADADEHGCKASAGYQWSVVEQRCVRLFETGTALYPVKEPEDSGAVFVAYVIMAKDSLLSEVFIPGNIDGDVLERRKLPNGSYVWNMLDDDTPNLSITNGLLTLSRRGKVIYQEK